MQLTTARCGVHKGPSSPLDSDSPLVKMFLGPPLNLGTLWNFNFFNLFFPSTYLLAPLWYNRNPRSY